MIRTRTTVAVLAGIILCSPVVIANSLAELERRCETERERLIAPLKNDAINQCVADRTAGSRGQRNSREHLQYCQRYYADFGQGGRTAQGGFRQRMFHDIPQCQAFYEAERSARRR